MRDALLVVAGGGFGSLCRYLVSGLAMRRFGDSFAWGTMSVNLIGCFAVGLLAGLVERSALPAHLRVLAISGFLGGFTTFSTFSLESVRMIANGAPGKGFLNIGVNVILGLVLTLAGIALTGRRA